jgi:hypothetical protein
LSLRFAFAALTFSAAVAGGQEARYPAPQPTREELPAVAASLVSLSKDIAQIWPGFWSTEEPFLLVSPRGGMLLVAAFAPPPEYVLLPAPAGMPVLANRSYGRDGALPGSSAGTFPGLVTLNGRPVYALPPMGSTLSKRAGFYAHEAFHQYQREGSRPWATTPEDTIMGLFERALKH